MNVQDLLAEKQIPFQAKGQDFVVRCLSPEHDDSNPSMYINQTTGLFHCFSCGFKGNLFNFYGRTVNQLQLKRETLKKKIALKMAESIGLSMPKDYSPYVGNWRNIRPETYKEFEAFLHVGAIFRDRINFPIRDISGKIVAFQGRHTAGGTPKYKFSPPGAKIPLYPLSAPQAGEVLLVEGLFDVLNLYDKGLRNAVCCFGTNNINEDKLRMLSIQGVSRVGVFFDGDDAGQKAAETIIGMCEKVGLLARNIHLKDMDPGALTESQVRNLERRLYG